MVALIGMAILGIAQYVGGLRPIPVHWMGSEIARAGGYHSLAISMLFVALLLVRRRRLRS
jgi:hypothetical protein